MRRLRSSISAPSKRWWRRQRHDEFEAASRSPISQVVRGCAPPHCSQIVRMMTRSLVARWPRRSLRPLSLVVVMANCAPSLWKPLKPVPDVDTLPREQIVQVLTRGEIADSPTVQTAHYWGAVILTRDSITGVRYQWKEELFQLIHGDTTRQRLSRTMVDAVLVSHEKYYWYDYILWVGVGLGGLYLYTRPDH
jgi:hypothetical protein